MDTVRIAAAFLALLGVLAVVVAEADPSEVGHWALVLAPVTVFGALVGRWWTLALPLLYSAGYVAVRWVIDETTGECSICTSDDDWGNYPLLIFVFATVPVTFALLLGLVTGTLARAVRRR